ncbi:unnamed protein product [Phytophthora lilii]|uniref:Unnamed protein product n=1 Tax=Phytophthora lilii TaxID=2077276 RepID=A0A9W6X0J9_9STRA|nr:unnamed protein product [Phytophthora lilii]
MQVHNNLAACRPFLILPLIDKRSSFEKYKHGCSDDEQDDVPLPFGQLGTAGLQAGARIVDDESNNVDSWYRMMTTAFKAGINLSDNAECYEYGKAEELMGGAIKKGITDGVWSREDLVVTH